MSRARHAKGGRIDTNQVGPKAGATPATEFSGKAVEQEAKKKSDGFKKGGKVDGCAPGMRGDKAPRKAGGGAVGANMRGRSPFSAAKSAVPQKNQGKAGDYY